MTPFARIRPAVSTCAALALIAIVLAVTLPRHAGGAAANGRLSIAPLRFESTAVDPGGTIDGYVVKATNTTSRPVRIEVRAVQLEGSRDPSRLVQPTRAGGDRGVTSWVQLPYTAATWPTIAPGATLPIDVSIRVPADAAPGAYAVALGVFTSVATPGVDTGIEASSSEGRVSLDAGVGSTIVFDVTGDARPGATIPSVDAPRIVWSGDRPEFEVRVENTGTMQLQFDARVSLSPFWGSAGRQLDARSQVALPQGRRDFTLRWSDPPLFGWFEPKVTVVGGPESGVSMTRTLPTVWVLPPWWLIVLLVLAIALPIVLAVRRDRSGRGRAVRAAKARARVEREQRVAAAKQRAADARSHGGRR